MGWFVVHKKVLVSELQKVHYISREACDGPVHKYASMVVVNLKYFKNLEFFEKMISVRIVGYVQSNTNISFFGV